jgi:hypothetical protein
MQHRFKTRRTSPHQIQVFVDRIEQLFNSIAEEFIVSWVHEFPTNDPISLVIQVDPLRARGDVQESVQTATRNYLAYRMKTEGFRAASSSQARPDEFVHRARVFKRLYFDQPRGRPSMAGHMVRLGSRKSYHRRLGRHVATDGNFSL